MATEEDISTMLIMETPDGTTQLDTQCEVDTFSPASLVRLDGSSSGILYNLDKEVISIGRLQDNDIPLIHSKISRHHLQILYDNGHHFLKDNHSTNGTYLNGNKIQSAIQLHKGDIIRIGSARLKYLPSGDPERSMYEKLLNKALTDPHTGCYNKSHFLRSLEDLTAQCLADNTPLCLMIMDIDRLKELNDNYGHHAGDYVIVEVVRLIKEQFLHPSDLLGRFGGDEFVLLMPNEPLSKAKERAETLRKTVLNHPFNYEQKVIKVTLSIGLATLANGIEKGSDLFKRADFALYESKKEGRNRVSLYNASSFG